MKKLILILCFILLLIVPEVSAQSIVGYQQGFTRNKAEALNEGLWDGLVGCWASSLGNTGNMLRDAVYGNNASFTNMDGSNWMIDSGRYCLDLDGSTESLQVQNVSNRYESLGALTISVWVKPDNADYSGVLVEKVQTDIVLEQTSSGSGRWQVAIATSGGSVTVQATTAPHAPPDITRWNHIAATYDGSTVRLYVNGREANTGSLTGTLIASGNDFHFGVNANSSDVPVFSWYDGSLGDICYYNRALTQSEITQLYVDPSALFRLKPQPFVVPVAASTRRIMFISQYINDLIETYKYN